MEQRFDKIKIHFEAIDDFINGSSEKVSLEKETNVVSGIETHLDKLIDTFAEFLIAYGFNQQTILNGFEEYLQEMKG